MASELQVDELKGVTTDGDITITSEGGSATMQLQQGLLKYWASFDSRNTPATRDSFNIASISDVATGRTKLSFTNDFSNDDYIAGGTGRGRIVAPNAESDQLVGEVTYNQLTDAGSLDDANPLYAFGAGDLA